MAACCLCWEILILSMSTLKDGPSRWLLKNLVLLAKDDCVELWEVWRYNSSFFVLLEA